MIDYKLMINSVLNEVKFVGIRTDGVTGGS